MNKILVAAAITAALGLAATTAGAVNLVKNGNFETTTLTHSAEITATNLANWTSVSTGGYNSNKYSVVYLPGEATTLGATGTGDGANNFKLWSATASPVGGNFVAIDADVVANSMLQQMITGLVVGQTYDLSFYYAGAQATTRNGATTESWQVSLGNESHTTASISNASHGFTGWFKAEMQFVATSGSEVLSFLALGTPSGLPPVSLLDGVTMTAAVPEPSTWAMMVLGMGLVAGGSLRSRRRKVAAA